MTDSISRDIRIFISYTTREEEVRTIQPLVDKYCRGLWERARQHGVDVFYDHFALKRVEYSRQQLEGHLLYAIKHSHMMTAFLSPGYVESEWCQFEWDRWRDHHQSGWVHLIYWKPTISARQFAELSPTALKVTDVTYAYNDSGRLAQAAQDCVIDSMDIIGAILDERRDKRDEKEALMPVLPSR
jgi:hypothetical protein